MSYHFVPTQRGSEERSESRARVRRELAYTPYAGVSESPEIGESGRSAGVEFHPVAGESRCAGVHVFYFNLRPLAHAAVSLTQRAAQRQPVSQPAAPHTTCKRII